MYHTTRRHIPEYHNLNIYRGEIFKSHIQKVESDNLQWLETNPGLLNARK
jgi:hypothetical protein